MRTMSLVLMALAYPAAANAADFSLAPDGGKPMASMSVADSWKPKLGSHGLEGTAPDGHSFVIAKIIKGDEKTANDYDAETTRHLAEQGVDLPPPRQGEETKTVDTDIKVNDLDAFVSRLEEPITFKGAPTTVTYYAIPLSQSETLNIITGGPENDPALDAIINSVKAVK